MKLKHKILLVLLTLLTFVGAHAEGNERIDVDLNLIKVNVTMNPEHYRDLMDRYLKADTTLRLDEMATVYYGYASTIDYAPDLTFPEIDEAIADENYDKAFRLSIEAAKEAPLSLPVLINVIKLMPQIELKENLDAYLNIRQRLEMLIGTILASGTGIRRELPFKVISEGDMMVILKDILNVEEIVGRSKIGEIDAVKITFPTNSREHILYFDNTIYDQYKRH
ncbi:MAG: DUF4919 domain-containing protein [Muribaculaceae bacterium]|nr:DUF4919 domain-containing protein [Muribaculaceae bacterium]